jgi:hypothetical protein
MNATTNSTKSRTASLPKVGKTGQGYPSSAKSNDSALDDGVWNSVAFPYLLPLSRRVS